MVKSNYEILGITEGASRNEIRSAFRNLALTHHADRGGQDEEFIIIKQAFEDLKVGKKFPDSLDEKKKKSKFFWGTDEEERLRQNTLLSNDVARATCSKKLSKLSNSFIALNNSFIFSNRFSLSKSFLFFNIAE